MDSWSSQIARPMGDVEPLCWLFIIPFLALIGLGFLNLLSAIFVDSLLEMNKDGAREEHALAKQHEERTHQALHDLFILIDTSGEGAVSPEELHHFLHTLSQERWSDYLHKLEVSPESMEVAAKLFEVHHDQEVNPSRQYYFDDFVRLLRTMNTAAQMKDVWKTQLMVEHIQQRVVGVESMLQRQMALLTKMAAAQGIEEDVPPAAKKPARSRLGPVEESALASLHSDLASATVSTGSLTTSPHPAGVSNDDAAVGTGQTIVNVHSGGGAEIDLAAVQALDKLNTTPDPEEGELKSSV